MLQELDRLVRDLLPIFTILAPLVTSLAAFITVKIKAPQVKKRRQKPRHIQARHTRKRL